MDVVRKQCNNIMNEEFNENGHLVLSYMKVNNLHIEM
jgi:hypothetical protein